MHSCLAWQWKNNMVNFNDGRIIDEKDANFDDGGTIPGSGNVSATFYLYDTTITSGNPIGELTVQETPGYGVWSVGSTLDIELAGAAGYDRLVITQEGIAFRDLTVNVTLRQGFVPQSGDSFTILNATYITEHR